MGPATHQVKAIYSLGFFWLVFFHSFVILAKEISLEGLKYMINHRLGYQKPKRQNDTI